MYWWGSVWGIVILTLAAMIYLYDIFPARARCAATMGICFTILTNETNQEAYNQILLAEDRMAKGLPAGRPRSMIRSPISPPGQCGDALSEVG
jgi:hypothetical protein